MNLRELQSSFARLVTDDAFRHRAQEDAAGANGNGELQSLARERGVDAHAMTLKRKRLGAARSRIPMTSRILAAGFSSLFDEFAGTHRLNNSDRDDNDALAFLSWLIQPTSAGESRIAAFGISLQAAIRFEQSELRARLFHRRFQFKCIDGRVLPNDVAFPKSRTICIWIRRSRRRRLHRWIIPLTRRRPLADATL